jgi:hypothetical protein
MSHIIHHTGSDIFTKGSFGDSARYRSIGRIRGEVRRRLAPHLAEIDGLVRGLLGIASTTGG